MRILPQSLPMNGRRGSMLVLLSVFAAIFCTLARAADTPAVDKPSFVLTSPAFPDGGPLHPENASGDAARHCGGRNVSPALQWANPPSGTRSFAIVMSDPDGRNGLGISHWVAYGIAADTRSLAEGMAAGPSRAFVGGRNTRGGSAYEGPCPPPGSSPHHYLFTIVATDLAPDSLAPGLDRAGLAAALEGHALGGASIVGRYAR